MTYTKDFEAFCRKYPGKVNKSYASEMWNKKKKKKQLPAIGVLFHALENQIREKTYLKNSGQFVPGWKNLSTWINQACWDDECKGPKKKPAPKKKGGNGINVLHDAYDALVRSGEPEFNKFCDSVGLQAGERDLVVHKFKVLNGLTEKVGTRIPKSPKKYQGPRPPIERG